MKKLLLAASALAALATPAFAADLPSRKEAVLPPPPPMWTGFYAGLNAGYNFGTNANVYSQNWGTGWSAAGGGDIIPSAAPLALDLYKSNTQDGFIGGAQFGYNWQYGSNFVIGVETDIQGANIRGTISGSGLAAIGVPAGGADQLQALGATVVQAGVDYLGTIRGRLGYLVTPTLLLYGTGGFAYGGAWANVAQQAIDQAVGGGAPLVQASTFGGGRQNQLLTGWTAGGGAEWMFMPNWSLKGEALYWDLGRMNVNTVNYGISPLPTAVNNTIGWGRTSVNYAGVQAKVGVNYHFNWGAAPIVAKF